MPIDAERAVTVLNEKIEADDRESGLEKEMGERWEEAPHAESLFSRNASPRCGSDRVEGEKLGLFSAFFYGC